MANSKPVPTYAKVGDDAGDWLRLRVIDEATGAAVFGVTEVNTVEGWAVRYAEPTAKNRAADGLQTERITGRFRLEWVD